MIAEFPRLLLCILLSESRPNLRNRDEIFDKTEQLPLSMESSVHEGNEGEQIILFLQLLRLVENDGHFNSGKEKTGKLTDGDYLIDISLKKHLDMF